MPVARRLAAQNRLQELWEEMELRRQELQLWFDRDRFLDREPFDDLPRNCSVRIELASREHQLCETTCTADSGLTLVDARCEFAHWGSERTLIRTFNNRKMQFSFFRTNLRSFHVVFLIHDSQHVYVGGGSSVFVFLTYVFQKFHFLYRH